jgi:hypothetical protein
MLQPGQELSPEEVVAMKRDEETARLSTLLATPMGKAMFSDGPEYTPEEVVTMQAAEAQAEIPAEQVLVQQVLELNDPNAPDQPKDEWRRRTQLKKTLQEQGLLDSDFMATAKGVGGLVVTIADGVTSPLRYDPRNENGDVIPAKDGLEYISRYNPAMWPAAVSDAINRSPATLNYAGELLQQGYGIMNDGLAGLGGPRYKIKETGEFITEMDRAMYRTKVAQTGGLAGDPSDDALIKQYAAQGMTLEPVTPEDVEEFEYQQHLRFRGRLKSIEQKRTEGAGPEVATSSLMTAGAAPLDWLTGSNYMDQVWGKKMPAESQAMVMQMGADPLVWTSFGAGLTRLGVSTAAKGGGARILDAIGKGAQKMARPTEQSLREVQRFQNAVWSKGRVALYAGGLAGMNYSSLPEPLKNAMNVAAAAYVIHKGGAGTLRWVGDKFPQAAVMLREAADPLNGADIMARQAIAKNPKIPAGIRERVAKPSQFMAMESTPARLARNETLSPKTRKMMERLSNFYVVQGVRGASAVATGATKGAIVSAPFAELTRGGGDEEGANLIYGAGTALGGAGGAASRVLGARNRTVARAESDIGRMLVDIQATVPELQRQGAVKRNQWFDRELNRFLTDVELAGGDIAHMFQARSFDEIARTAAMQGLFRNVDYVPLNDADFALNAKAHGQSGAAGFYLHNPDGARPRLFVNLDARRADVDAHEFGEAFFSSDAFSPEQKAAMRAEVDARYGPEGVMARAREYAEQMIKSENARNFPNENLVVSDDQIRAKMDELAQDELGRGGQDPADWARREIMVEEWRMAGTDYARLRRGVPAGANPVTFVENILGANARALGLSGVRVDPETGKAITPDQLFKENPVAADDPIVNRNLRAYIKTYNTWLNDPSQEVPSGVKVARDGNVQSLANNPNVDFYSINPDDPTAPRENTFGVLGPDGRVVEKQPKQRRDERKARNSQVKNMAGRNLLAPGDAAFGLKRWGDGRVRAGGRRLPQSIILQNHWKPWLPIINMLEGMADSGESVQVRYFAVGNSADKVKTAKLKDVDAINREMVFDQWTTNAAGDLLAQFLDLTAMRNRAMRAIGERNPALDPANGGPGYSLQAIMDDVNQWMADKRAGKAGEATIGPDRKNIVNALINPGTTLNRGKNPLAGSMGKGSAIKTLILEGINAVSGTGRKGAAMDYNWANGNFMPDQPPRPDVDIDLPQESMPQQIPRDAQGMPDAVDSLTTDQLLRQYEENQGYLGLSTLGMREGRPVRGGAAQTRELLRRNEAISAELERRGVREEDPQLQRALQRRGQAMPDVSDGLPRRDMQSRGKTDISNDGTVTYSGKEPKDWSPQDFAGFGKDFGVRNLGPLSKVTTITDSVGRTLADIPGGIEGKFTYYDLLWLKANPVDVGALPLELHGKLTAKLARTMTPERGNDVQKFNGILFGMLSPNSPLLPNEFGQARMRFGSMDEIKKFAGLLPDNPTKEQRKSVNQRLKKELGFTSAKSGGLGIGISVDLSNIVMAAKLFVKKPDFFIKKPNESWANFVDKLTTQVSGLGTKTASFGGVWQDPLMAGISAMDRHMARAFSEELIKNPDVRGRFEGIVVKRFNDLVEKSKKTAKKEDAKIQRAKTEAAKAKAIEAKTEAMENLPDPLSLKADTLDDVLGQAEVFGADRIKNFVNEAVFAAMGSRKAKYTVKGGAINPNLPESLQGVEWVEAPKDFQVMSDAYRSALEINAQQAKKIGIEIFPSQWTLWDRIRGRVEPHEAMFPGLERLPALNDRQLGAAYAANKQAGYARNVKAGQEWKRKSGLSPSSLAYFTPAVLAAGAALSQEEQ